MAIKLSGSISRKVPIDGVQFSSQSFGAAMEIEIGTDNPTEVREKLAHLYSSLSDAIDEQIACSPGHLASAHGNGSINGNGNGHSAPAPSPVNRVNGHANGVASKGTTVNATQAQSKAIFAICKSLNLDLKSVLAQHNVTDATQLTVRAASALIDSLKARQNGSTR